MAGCTLPRRANVRTARRMSGVGILQIRKAVSKFAAFETRGHCIGHFPGAPEAIVFTGDHQHRPARLLHFDGRFRAAPRLRANRGSK